MNRCGRRGSSVAAGFQPGHAVAASVPLAGGKASSFQSRVLSQATQGEASGRMPEATRQTATLPACRHTCLRRATARSFPLIRRKERTLTLAGGERRRLCTAYSHVPAGISAFFGTMMIPSRM